MLHVVRLVGEDIFIRVHAAHAWLAQALSDEFDPYLTARQLSSGHENNEDAAQELVVTVDHSLADRLKELAVPHVGLTSLAPSYINGGTWRMVGKQAVLGGCHATAFLLWRDADPTSSHLVLQDGGLASRRLLLRIVRAVAARVLIAAGWIPLHAACAATPAGAVCLLGGRGSGKTTALLQLLAAGQEGTAFVANDTVFVSGTHDGFQVCALPVAAAIRPPTVRMFPVLAALADRNPVWEADTSTLGQGNMLDARRLLVTPRQFAAAFQIPLVPRVPLAAILGIDYQSAQANAEVPRWRRLRPQDARKLCSAAYQAQWLPDDTHELARLPAVPHLRYRHGELLEAVARTIPAAIVRPASGAASGAALLQILDELVTGPLSGGPIGNAID